VARGYTLAAVLAGRKVQPLVQTLINRCESAYINALDTSTNVEDAPGKNPHPAHLLAQCILDEIQISPDILKEGFDGSQKTQNWYDYRSNVLLYLEAGMQRYFVRFVETSLLILNRICLS
jgi:hypothetical protein